MKKLYRKGTVHPSPPNKLDQLTFLPAAILTLAAALSPEEKEVLAYLISCSNSAGNSFSNIHQHHRRSQQSGSSSSSFARSNTTGSGDHPLSFKCDCFRCYMSYWARWDSSPNRQLIHEIIEAFEDWLVQSSKSSKKNRKDRKKKGSDNDSNNRSNDLKRSEESQKNELGDSESMIESGSSGGDGGGGGGGGGNDEGEGEGEEKGSVRRLMNFIGERIWGVWGSSI